MYVTFYQINYVENTKKKPLTANRIKSEKKVKYHIGKGLEPIDPLQDIMI